MPKRIGTDPDDYQGDAEDTKTQGHTDLDTISVTGFRIPNPLGTTTGIVVHWSPTNGQCRLLQNAVSGRRVSLLQIDVLLSPQPASSRTCGFLADPPRGFLHTLRCTRPGQMRGLRWTP